MKWMNQAKLLATGVLLVTMLAILARANSNSGSVSASDQQTQAIDLAGKKSQQKVDLFTGSFGYSVPITCAPARNGSQPNLALGYSSAGELGWCGMGWNLEIGSIERNSRDGFPITYSTTTPPAPLNQYDDGRGFMLNLSGKGAKLISVSTNSGIIEYRAEVDTDFLRCFLNTNNNSWTIYDKSGTAYYFGETTNTRVANPKTGWSGYSGTFHWALDQIITATGDWTTIAYTNYASPITGQPEKILYPTQITYNGHTNYNYSANATGANTITFQTELRTNDWRFAYRWGFRTEQCRRLTNIVCSVGTQKVWSYNLKYGISPATSRSLLMNVVIYGFDGSNIPTAYSTNTFAYQANSSGVSFGSTILWTNLNLSAPGGGTEPEVTQVNQANGFNYTLADLMDIDGDGLPDRVVYDGSTTRNQYLVQKNLGLQANGSGSFGTRYTFGQTSTGSGNPSDNNPFPDGSGYAELNSPNGRIRDINGDGLPDRVLDYWKPFDTSIYPNNTPYTNFTIAFNTGSGFSSATQWAVTNLIGAPDGNNAHLPYQSVEGGGSVTYGYYAINIGVGLFDIGGGGLPDRVLTTFAPYEVMTNLYVQVNSGTNFSPTLRRFPYKSQNCTASDPHTVSLFAGIETLDSHFMDLNGDGLPDHLMWPYNTTNINGEASHPVSYYAVEYNNGYSFESTNTSTSAPGAFDPWPGVVAQTNNGQMSYGGVIFWSDNMVNPPFSGLWDLNGDGLPDRVVVDESSLGYPQTRWFVYLNTSHGFDTTPITLTNIENEGHTNFTTDVPWWSPQGSYNGSQITTLMDINGDGLLDRVLAVYYSSSPSSNYFLVQLNSSPFPDLLTNINNGIGGTIAVTYNSSAAYDNRVDTSNSNSVSHMPYPRQVTATVTSADGINAPQTTSYSYAGGYFDGPRREFHGFAVVSDTDPTLRYTVSYFHTGGGRNYAALGEYQDTNSTAGNFAKAGMPYRVETYGNDNALYHVQVNQVDQVSLGNGRYFPFTTLALSCDYPGNGTPKVTATDFAYDLTTGNLTNKIEFGQVTGFNPTNVGSFTFTNVSSADDRIYITHYTTIGTYMLDHPDLVALLDASNNVIQEKDFAYYGGGTLATKLTRISASSFATNSYGNYTIFGLVGQTTDPVGVQTAIAYDSTYNTFPTTTITGTFTNATTYDPRSGQVASSTDPAGVTVTNTFDAFLRPTESDKIAIGGAATVWVKKYFYPATLKPIVAGLATNYVDVVANDGVGGYTNRTYMDGFGRAIQTRTQGENGNFRVVSTAYDPRGNPFLKTWPTFESSLGYTKPANQTASWTGFDAAGRAATNRLVTATFSSGAFTSKSDLASDSGSPLGAKTWSYANGGDPWWIICTDEDNQIRRYGLDAFGRTNQIQEVDGASTYTNVLKYDLADNLTNIGNAIGENIYFAFNNIGGMVAMADPYLGQWTYQRDFANRTRVQTDGRGNVIKLFYVNAAGQQDPLGRVLRKEIYSLNYTNSTLVPVFTNTYVFDSSDDGSYTVFRGLLYKTTDSEGYEKNSYDNFGRLIKTTRHLNILNKDYTTSYTYNDGDNVTSTAYPNAGPVITNTYFHGGSLNQVARSGSTNVYYTVTATGFDEFSHVTNVTFGNGLTTTRSYYANSKRLQTIACPAIFNRSFTYTAGDDIASLSGTGLVSTVTVTYANLHRIKSYTGLTNNYTYDPAGNLSNNIEGSGVAYGYGVRRPQAVKLAFGLTNLYDLCGNMIVRHGGATNAQKLDYDAENHLTRFAQAGTNFLLVKYGYAADEARLWKWNNQTPTNLQVWIGSIYEEKQGKTLFHVYAGGEQVCTFESGSPLYGGTDTNKVGYYYHQDQLGSSSVLSGSSGAQQEVNVYYPFGRTQTTSPQAGFKLSRQFTGQIRDEETGFYYYNARYYDPELGRFMQADTVIPDLGNPQSYNRYAYCLNDPLRYNDPTGHAPSDWADSMQPAIDNYYGGYISNPSHTSTLGLFGAYMGQSVAGGYNDMLRFGTGMEQGTLEGWSEDLGRGGGIILTVSAVAPKTAPVKVAAPEVATPKVAPEPETSGNGGPYSHLKDHSSVGPGKDFTQTQKKAFRSENIKKNGGIIRDDDTGQNLVLPRKHQKGVTPPSDEAHVDHIIPKSKGGSNSATNAKVISRERNLEKSNN